MSPPVFFTRSAERDLEAISRYIRNRDGAERSHAVAERIRGLLELLEGQPEAGSVPAELAVHGITEFRQLVSSPYRVIYTYTQDAVYVLLIADGRRDFQAMLKQRMLTPDGH